MATKFKVRDILEVTVDDPQEYDGVKRGALGIVYEFQELEGEENRYFANWVNPDGEGFDGFVLEKNLKKHAPSTPPIKLGLVEYLINLAISHEALGARRPRMPWEKIKEFAALWDDSSQGIYEMIAWILTSSKAQDLVRMGGAKPFEGDPANIEKAFAENHQKLLEG